MKKIVLAVMAACIMSASVPALAAEMSKEEKNQCLLAAKNCASEVDSIQQRIRRLSAEINEKGASTYTLDELKVLDRKLKESNEVLKALQKPR